MKMESKLDSVCVFCGASPGNKPVYREAAYALGKTLAEQQIGLVWGGGKVGLMGTVADGVLDHGGRAVGVIPTFMMKKELAHPGASEMLEVDSMHTRKALMAERADGFIALPGGLGTFDELFEIMTWAQLHIHAKPIGLLNVQGYFDALLAMVKHAVQEGFVKPANLALFTVADNPPDLLAQMRRQAQPAGEWYDKLSTDQA